MPSALRLDDSPAGKILTLLQQHGTCSIKELEAELGVTRTAVRQQLMGLLAAELVTAAMVHQGRGRPYTVYHLSDKGHGLFPRLYEDLALVLLEELLERAEPAYAARLLQRLSVRLGRQYAAQLCCSMTLAGSLRALSAWLTAHGILTEVREDEGAFVLTEHSCPFYGLARTHREICAIETEALALALDTPVQLLQSQRNGSSCCRFQVQKRAEGSNATARGGQPGRAEPA